MMTNTELLAVAKKQLGNGGSKYRKYVGASGNYCNMFVYWLFNANGCGSLFPLPATKYYRTYCPDSIKWCRKNLAEIPPYIAMACDIIYMDWEPNGVPNHIGIVDHKVSTTAIATIEGNTSGGIVAAKTRNTKYTNIFRPHFKGTYKKVPLVVDGDMGYQTIGGMQAMVGASVDTILGIGTVKKVQAYFGASQDGAWGTGTSKKLQSKMAKEGYYTGKIDGAFGEKSVVGLQKMINAKLFTVKPAEPATPTEPAAPIEKTKAEKIIDRINEYAYEYGTSSKKYKYKGGSPKKAYKSALKKYMKKDAKISQSDCGYFVSTVYRSVGCKGFLALAGRKEKFPKVPSTVKVVHKGKKIPSGLLQPGDVIRYKKKGGGQHTLMYYGNGKIAEAGRGHYFPAIKKNTKKYNKANVKKSTIEVLRVKE